MEVIDVNQLVGIMMMELALLLNAKVHVILVPHLLIASIVPLDLFLEMGLVMLVILVISLVIVHVCLFVEMH